LAFGNLLNLKGLRRWYTCMFIVVTAVLDLSIVRSCKPTTFLRVVVPLSAGGTRKDENLHILVCALCKLLLTEIESLRATLPDGIFYWGFCFLNRAFR
jgi:hypothetical protein